MIQKSRRTFTEMGVGGQFRLENKIIKTWNAKTTHPNLLQNNILKNSMPFIPPHFPQTFLKKNPHTFDTKNCQSLRTLAAKVVAKEKKRVSVPFSSRMLAWRKLGSKRWAWSSNGVKPEEPETLPWNPGYLMKGSKFSWVYEIIPNWVVFFPHISPYTKSTTRGPIISFFDFQLGGTSLRLNQPIWKICSSNWIISPGRGENKKHLKPPPSSLLPTKCVPWDEVEILQTECYIRK